MLKKQYAFDVSVRSMEVELNKDDFYAPELDIGPGALRAVVKCADLFNIAILSVQLLVKNGKYHEVNDASFEIDSDDKSITIWKSPRFNNYKLLVVGI